MPLSRDNVTYASRIMLPAYALHAAFFGFLYAVDPDGRYQLVPGLALARELMPMAAWGAILLTVSAVIAAALISHSRLLMICVLYLYASINLTWAVIYAGAVFINHNSSFGQPLWPLFAAVCCVASATSLMRRDTATHGRES